LADKHGVNLEGALTWAFEFEDQPYFAGFRSLATNGIEKPVLNVFRMFGKMSDQKLAVTSDHATPLDVMLKTGVRDRPDVTALATLDQTRLCVMVWHYHDDDVPGPSADVQLSVVGLPAQAGDARLTHYRIDGEHSNAFSAWKGMGSPQSPSAEQYDKLLATGKLAVLDEPSNVGIENGQAKLSFLLPRQGVSLLVLEWPR
jgi:xylan 1,4-beta-xylosidase